MKKKSIKVELNGVIHCRFENEIGIYYTVDGKFHREDSGPAVIFNDRTFEWYKNGRHHREGGPAIEYLNGTKYWMKDGLLHREDGPALKYIGGEVYYLNNRKYSKEEFNRIINEKNKS